MWNLDDKSLYEPFLRIEIPDAFTWGGKDRAKREVIRQIAAPLMPLAKPEFQAWAFRILVRRPDSFDVDNVPKVIIDAFCTRQIKHDNSQFTALGLYTDDTAQYVAMVQIAGQQSTSIATVIEIFGCKAQTASTQAV